MLVLLASLLELGIIVAPLFSILGFFRIRALRAQVEGMRDELAELDRRVNALSRTAAGAAAPPHPAAGAPAPGGATGTPPPARTVTVAPATISPPQSPPAPGPPRPARIVLYRMTRFAFDDDT